MFLLSTLNKSKNAAGEKSDGSGGAGFNGLFTAPNFSITQATYHEGYLYHKTGGTFSAWKKKSQELETIFLEGSYVEPFSEKKKFGFTLHCDLRNYILAAENEKDSEEWITKITEIGGSKKEKQPTLLETRSVSSHQLNSMKSMPQLTLNDDGTSTLTKNSRKSSSRFMSPIAKTFSDIVEKKERRDSELTAKKKEHELVEAEIKLVVEEVKKPKREPKYTIEQEFDIFLSAMNIFMKEESERTPEENAYILNLKLYYHQLNEHMSKTKAKPEFSISTGTYILVKEDEFRTQEELEFLNEMKKSYESWLKNDEDEDLKLEVYQMSKEILEKSKKSMTKSELEYKRNLDKTRKLISTIEKTHGLKAQFDIISGTVNLLKYKEELTQMDHEYLTALDQISN